MKKGCYVCNCEVEVENSNDPYMICCPDCVAKIEETVLSKGLIVSAPYEPELSRPIFMKYFEKYKFSEFERYFGYSESTFKIKYEVFKMSVIAYCKGYCCGYGNGYKENEKRGLLVANIGCCYNPVFYIAIGKQSRDIDYFPISILKKEYCVLTQHDNLEFVSCEELMREMLYFYWKREEFTWGKNFN